MKLLTLLILGSLTLQAAEITITVRNDGGTVVSTVTITGPNFNNAVLKAINEWRLAQIKTPAQPGSPGCPTCTPPVAPTPAVPAVLTYPTTAAMWQHIVRAFVRPILIDYHPAIITERGISRPPYAFT